MQVILLESVAKLGKVGEEVRVKPGFGRNFLIPQGKALRATNENRQVFETKRAEIEKANEAKKSEAAKIAKKIDDKFITVIRQAGEDGHLYGSVTSRDIAAAVTELAGVEINHKQVVINKPIKTVGVYVQAVDLHADVPAAVNVVVARVDGEVEQLKEAFLNPESNKDHEDITAEVKKDAAAKIEVKSDEEIAAEEEKKAAAAEKSEEVASEEESKEGDDA